MTYALIAISFLSSLLMLSLAKSLAFRFNLMDVPGGRKGHEIPTPTIGGLGMFLAFASMALMFDKSLPTPILIGMALMTIMGNIDDKLHLPEKIRLILQISITAGSFYAADLKVLNLGNVLGMGQIELGWLALPFTVICVCGLINAINMIDGLDGLAGGITAGSLLLIILVNQLASNGMDMTATILLSVVAGFLVMNSRYPGHKKASIFMGDGGSYFLGFALAYLVCDLAATPGVDTPPISLAWIVAFPVISIIRDITCRVLRGDGPFKSSRDHLHYLLIDYRDMEVSSAVALIVGLNLLTGCLGVLSPLLFETTETGLFLGLITLLPVMFMFTTWAAGKTVLGQSEMDTTGEFDEVEA